MGAASEGAATSYCWMEQHLLYYIDKWKQGIKTTWLTSIHSHIVIARHFPCFVVWPKVSNVPPPPPTLYRTTAVTSPVRRKVVVLYDVGNHACTTAEWEGVVDQGGGNPLVSPILYETREDETTNKTAPVGEYTLNCYGRAGSLADSRHREIDGISPAPVCAGHVGM